MQGFQTPIQNDSFVVDGMGALGTTHTERGLTYFEVALSGHMYVTLRARHTTQTFADACSTWIQGPAVLPKGKLL